MSILNTTDDKAAGNPKIYFKLFKIYDENGIKLITIPLLKKERKK